MHSKTESPHRIPRRIAVFLLGALCVLAWARPLVAQPNELLRQGQTLFQRGDYAQAVQIWRTALNQDKVSGEQRTDLLLRLATAQQALGQYSGAYASLQQASTAEDQATPAQRVLIHSQLGDVLLAMQRPEAAEKQLLQALGLARQQGGEFVLAHTLNNLGNYYSVQENYPKALDSYAQVSQLNDPSLAELHLQALFNQARIHLIGAQPKAAQSTLEQLRKRLQTLPTARQTQHLLNLAELYLRLAEFAEFKPGALQQAQTSLQTGLNVGEANLSPRQLINLKGYLGKTVAQLGQAETALDLLREALFLAQSAPDLLYRWEWERGRVLQRQGRLIEAEQAYFNSVQYLNPIRTKLLMGLRGASRIFAERISPVYYDLADVLLQRAHRATDVAERSALLEQAREVMEELKRAEMQDYYHDECVVKDQVTRLDELAQGTAVLYPIALSDRTELLLSLNGKLSSYRVNVNQATLKEVVIQFQHNLQVRTKWNFARQGRVLYDWLIAPVRAELDAAQVHTLVLVPDASLRMIPLAPLFDGKQFLIENFALATTPGMNLTEPKILPRDDLTVLLNGLSEAVQNFTPLPNVPEEIHNIKDLYHDSEVLLNAAYRVDKVSEALQTRPYTIVHIASHGQFRRDPEQTFLLAYDDKITLNRLEELLSYSQYRKEAVELLTLSACQTAVGDEKAALGLAGVALKSGARSAVASLWFVNDESTSLLMRDFYTQLQDPGLNKAQALRAAQLKLLRQPQGKFTHPAYWSPFLLIGNWL